MNKAGSHSLPVHAESTFQFPQVLQRDFTHDGDYVLEDMKVQGQIIILASEELSVKPKRATANAKAFPSLRLPGKCGAGGGAQAMGSNRLGLNPSYTAF